MPLIASNSEDSTGLTYSSDLSVCPIDSFPAGILDNDMNLVPAALDGDGQIMWQTENWMSPQGYLNLSAFAARYGAAPQALTFYIKMRLVANQSLAVPDPWFITADGDWNLLGYEHDSATLTPTTDWAIYSRTFSRNELRGLSLTDTYNFWQLSFYDMSGDVPSSLSEKIQVAWLALSIVPPPGGQL